MPTYSYRCADCGHKFDVRQGINEAKLTVCGECSGALKRLVGAGSMVKFNCGGFYDTDYRGVSSR